MLNNENLHFQYNGDKYIFSLLHKNMWYSLEALLLGASNEQRFCVVVRKKYINMYGLKMVI